MKRGFLNTDKAKRKLAAATSILHDSPGHKDKGKAKAETSLHINEPRPHLPLLDLHSVPPSIKTTMGYPDRNRFIFRHWPRDPNGKFILPSDIHGKEAGNNLDLWGATLYDFYSVRRIPSSVHGLTISTGSKLINVMKAFGELDHAKDEIAWASREADPVEIPAWDPAEAIVAHERRVHASSGGANHTNKKSASSEISTAESEADVPMLDTSESVNHRIEQINGTVEAVKNPASEDSANEPSNMSTDSTNDVRPQQSSPDIPVESPFHSSHYPSPWPLVPFESQCSPFALHRCIPIHLLPKKLHVHDPWDLLNAGIFNRGKPDKSKEESWSSKTDHIRTYALSLPPESQRMVEAASNAAAAAEDEALGIPQTVFISPRETEGPTEGPAVRAFLPKRPRRPTEVPEAHLYLSPKGRLGTGNHSVVYEAELELPRDLFCESTYCKSCLDEQIKVEVDRLQESGEWERRMNEAAKHYEGTKGQDIASRDTSSSLQIPPRFVGFVKVRLEHSPMETVYMVGATTIGEAPPADAPSQHVRVRESAINHYIEYEGPVVPIHPNIQWQNPSFPDTICEHRARKTKSVPRTAAFRVAAKLSLPYDPQLEQEAGNYLKFPPHFFQHWSGYNVVPPLHDPTPVGALVPQYFGYYMPDFPFKPDVRGEYYSPILLIEHCGEPILVETLSIDDRHECAALLFRFHRAGWLHHSFAERNILMEKRHPTCSPLEDEDKCDLPHQHRRYSFRMIDFGRSVECEKGWEISCEEMNAKSLLGIL